MTRDRLPKREQRRLATLREKLEREQRGAKAVPPQAKAQTTETTLQGLLAAQAKYQRTLGRNEARDWKAVYDSERNRRFRHRAKTVWPPGATPRLRNVLK